MENSKKKFRNNKVFKAFIIIILVIFICLAVGITFFTVFYLSSTNSKSNLVNVKAVKPESNEPVNILLAGVDVGSKDANDTSTIVNGSNQKKANSLVVFHYEPKTNKLSIVFVPNNSFIKVDGEAQKLNYASAVDGPKYIVSSVEGLMNIKVNYYVQVDYSTFRNVIDSLGSVKMSIDKKMNYDDVAQDLHIHFDAGSTVKLDGAQAEEYYRWIKNNDETSNVSDTVRIKNDQAFMTAAMDKFNSFSTLFKYPSIISVLSNDIESNMTIYDILKYARTFSHLKQPNIAMYTAKGLDVTIEDNNYYLLDKAANDKLLGVTSKTSTINKGNLKIEVLNGTTTSGLAKQYKTALNNKGFTNVTTGNSPQKPIANTKMTFYGVDQNSVAEVKDDIGDAVNASSYELITDKSKKYDIVIVLGNDIIK